MSTLLINRKKGALQICKRDTFDFLLETAFLGKGREREGGMGLRVKEK